MKFDAEFIGMKKFVGRLNALDNRVRKNSLRGMKGATAIIQKRAMENISGEFGHTRHVQTGNLRRRILTKEVWASLTELVGVIGTDVPYAPYIEALPDGGFLHPALLEAGKEALTHLKRMIERSMK